MANTELHNKTILGFFAHPDDFEILAAGTCIRLQKQGFEIHIATVCQGDLGSAVLPNPQISRIRYGEAVNAANIINGNFYCIGESDLKIDVSIRVREKIVELFRRINPQIVVTHSPEDYMPDHSYTSQLIWDACFSAPIPNYYTSEPNPAKPMDFIPYLYYADALEGKDHFGRSIEPHFYIDISESIDTKVEMLAQHDSQRSWLKKQHGMDHYIESMKEWCKKRGSEANVKYAEAFRQHLGHAFPQDNILKTLLGSAK